jgi:NTE family protein
VKIDASKRFVYREADYNSSMLDFAFSKDSLLLKSLPTNFISSSMFDFEMMRFLGTAGAAYGNDFDKLFVPFRCVASDIAAKKSVVFSTGDLQRSVRASMTFPFYFNPIRVNGVLFFDGGLYNNFPTNVMYNDFSPDYIIGSNVSSNAPPPDEVSLISQLTNMLVSYQDFELPCEEGFIIQPVTNISTFEFEGVKKAIDDGYLSAKSYLDSIELFVDRKVTKEELQQRRKEFRSHIPEIKISSISNSLSNGKDVRFARSTMLRSKKNEVLSADKFEQRFYRLNATEQIDFLYPTLRLKNDSTYNL